MDCKYKELINIHKVQRVLEILSSNSFFPARPIAFSRVETTAAPQARATERIIRVLLPPHARIDRDARQRGPFLKEQVLSFLEGFRVFDPEQICVCVQDE